MKQQATSNDASAGIASQQIRSLQRYMFI